MQFIPISPGSRAQVLPTDERAADALAGVIACIGSSCFANEALEQINRWMPVSWWSVFRLSEHAPPRMPASASYRTPDGTVESWAVYSRSLYYQDQTFLAARERVLSTERLLVHWHALEIPQPHREQIYTRHGLRERLSVVCRDKDESLLAINFYRHEDLSRFSDEEIDWVGSGANLLSSCVQRHLELVGAVECAADTVLEGLTRRERDVCERMLKGWTYDGIAVDLGVSAGTVKTYRDRAFDRLGIHHRNELFALVINRQPA
jgi:DNA-binding CsgD family transcriptional regulator